MQVSQSTMLKVIFSTIVLIFVGCSLAVPASDDGIITVPSSDIPSDGLGITSDSNFGSTSNSTEVSAYEDTSQISKIAAFLYNLTLYPIGKVTSFFIDPIIWLAEGITSPLISIADYFIGLFGIPTLHELWLQLVIEVESLFATVASNFSGLINALLGPQPHTRRKRGITSMVMAPVILPFKVAYETVSLPFKIVSTAYTVVTSPFRIAYRVLGFPLYYGYRLASYPAYYGYRGVRWPIATALGVTTWPARRLFRALGYGAVTDSGNVTADGEALLNTFSSSMNSTNGTSSTVMENIVGSISESAQQALITALIQAFQVAKTDVLPAFDSFIVQYQDNEMVPEALRKYIKSFHSAYSMLHMLRLL